MNTEDQYLLTEAASIKLIDAVKLVKDSIASIEPYNPNHQYTSKEREPYDALSDRFVKAVEISLKFFKTYEKLMYAESSDTTRDLLNKMEKLGFISSTSLWMDMRNIRNRIVHDYLPEQIQEIYNLLTSTYGRELAELQNKTSKTIELMDVPNPKIIKD